MSRVAPFRRAIRVALIAATVVTVLATMLASAHARSARTALPGSVPPWAKASNLKGAPRGSSPVDFRVYLGWRDAAGAAALARAVSDPASPTYHQYLTPEQFRQRFAPASAQVEAVRSWLRAGGFSITDVPLNRHYLGARGTVAQAEAAFGADLNLYSVDGVTLRSPNKNLTIPSSLAGTVQGVVGLDQSLALVHPLTSPAAPPPPAFVNAGPCSTYWAEKTTSAVPNPYGAGALPYAPCGQTPAQVQGAYRIADDIAAGNDGSGQTVAIIDAFAAPTMLADLNEYSSRHGLPTMNPGQYVEVTPPGVVNHAEDPRHDAQGWYGEETLDVESVHAMAPGAKIVFVGAPNSEQSPDATLNMVVDRHLAQIVSNSYGFPTELLPAGFLKPVSATFVQAAVTGIGLYFASGDNGDEIDNIGLRSVDWPPASPWVTAVGGTSLAVGASNQRLFETAWGTGKSVLTDGDWSPAAPGAFLYGSGGGTSRLFPQPSYQTGVVPSSIADYFDTGSAWRAVPDVSMDGDPSTGMLIGETQTFPDGSVKYGEYRLGGTSLSSPLLAGYMALADQKAGFAHGFANPAFYALAGTNAYNDIVDPASTLAVVRNDFNNGVDAADGVTTSLRTMNFTGTLDAAPGYDDVSGLGTPKNLLDMLGS
jgi:subtilase family serine protease